MIVNKINPQGFCKGVTLALKKCIEVINNPHTIKPIYLLGMIIHNRLVCEDLEEKGIIILEGTDKLSLLDSISEGTVIISAHGVSSTVKEKALAKNLNVVDTTCPDVKKVHDNVLKYLKEGYKILYIGKKDHPETIGVITESTDIFLIDNYDVINTLKNDEKYYVTNQTTLAHSQISQYHNEISKKLTNVVFENSVCLATTKREMALYDIKTELIVIVGDKNSSNTQKLVEVAKNKAQSLDVIHIERANDLLAYNLTKYKEAYVTSGASTPNEVVDKVIEFLKSDGKDLTILEESLFFF